MAIDMLELVKTFVKDSAAADKLSAGKDGLASSLQSLALSVAWAYKKKPFKLALGFSTLYELQHFSDFLTDFMPSEDIYLYPKDEILRLGTAFASKEMTKERLRTLYAMQSERPSIVLFNAIATLQRIETPPTYAEVCFSLVKGEKLSRDDLLLRLARAGYRHVDWVSGGFEFAVRGSIVDIFSPEYRLPLRLEFADEVIDDIRYFSPETEESTKEIERVLILPTSERPVTKDAIIAGKNALLAALKNTVFADEKTRAEKESEVNLALNSIMETGNIPETLERYFDYFPTPKATLHDYLKNFTTFLVDPPVYESTLAAMKAEEISYFQNLRKQGLALADESIYAKPQPQTSGQITIDALQAQDGFDVIHASNRSLNESAQLFHEALDDNLTVFACLDAKSLPVFTNYLSSVALGYAVYPERSSQITLVPQTLSKGFTLMKKVAFISAEEIFGVALKHSRFLTRYKDFEPVKKYADLKIGDYVVHEDHGIGIYEGLNDIDGLDYLKIKYARQAILYVPVFQFGKIRKYAGSEAARPALDVIGGSTWARRKTKIKERLSFIADRLLDIYAERTFTPGIAFKADREFEAAFYNHFQYPLTGSQQKAWEDISQDMSQPHPMDRLIAGDVGFGKTELAFRAAFRAIENGYQAAILCPTTVLARQHYEVAVERFKGFDVQIGLLSRFGSNKEIDQTLAALHAGKVQLLIGTHRLLSGDVKFKNLGFLTVDEEQKFGVTQKERIKELAQNVDVLSLSATPIPRTLQMSLLTIRPLSTLSEAPANRLPVKTYVVKENEGLIKEVIARELRRHGQVYFLHNRIETIYKRATSLSQMFPQATIGVAHGQLAAEKISAVMNDFYDGHIDILVSTSIIESGLDVPNVNTVLIEQAQNFGLSSLYQIKGRVGRSDRLAYAYLFYKDYDGLTAEGRERLKAIKEFTELGSGYKIAQRDLAIRGAGNILGKEQAGFIDSLGFATYTQLLTEVIRQKKDQRAGTAQRHKPQTRFLLSFTMDAKVPEDYANEGDRINLYRELADCTSREELAAFTKRVKDAFGPLPLEMVNLFAKREIEIIVDDEQVFDNLEEAMESLSLTLNRAYSDVAEIAKQTETILAPLNDKVQYVRFLNRRFIISLRRTVTYLADLHYLVSQISQAFYNRGTEA